MSFLPGFAPAQTLADEHDGEGDSWFTPRRILLAAYRAMGGIDLDTCGHPDSPAWLYARRSYCLQDGQDGLELPGDAQSIWVNCPYSDVAPWLNRCRISASEGKGVIAVIPTRPETRAWRKHIFDDGAYIIQQTGRIKFVGADGQTHGNGMITTCFVAWHEQIALNLREELAAEGIVSAVLKVMA